MKRFFIFVVVIGVLFLVGIIVVPRFIKKLVIKSVPFQLAKGTNTTTASGWQRFHSDQFGYSVEHPKGWVVSDADFAKKQEIWIRDTNKNAFVKINAYFDKSLNSSEAVKNAISAFKAKMDSESGLKATEFKDSFEGGIGGFIAKGEQMIDQETFLFESRGLLATNGRILIFHGAVKTSQSQKYTGIITKIITSFSLDKN